MRALPRLFWVTAQSFGMRSRVKRCDGCLQPGRSAFTLPERPKSEAQIILGHRPIERRAFPSPLLQRLAISGDRRFQSRRPDRS
jgi:hypothetical protein